MWRWQEEQNRQIVSSWMGFARMWRSLIREGRHDLARKPLQLRGAAEQCQDDVLDTGGLQLGELGADFVLCSVKRMLASVPCAVSA
jgi:hypothetical protein